MLGGLSLRRRLFSRPPPLRRDPDLPRLALLAAVLGLVAGYAGFTLRSSRGLDLIEAADALGSVALVALGVGVVYGVARVAMFYDWRAAAVALAVGVCLPVGHAAATLTLPGDTTDGTIIVDLPPLPEWQTVAVSTHGKCTWGPARTTVVAIDSRRASVRLPGIGQPRMTAHAELEPGDTGSITILVQPPLGGPDVYRYSGPGVTSFVEQNRRIGQVLARDMVRQRIWAGRLDPESEALLESTAPPVASATVGWTCPPWPRP